MNLTDFLQYLLQEKKIAESQLSECLQKMAIEQGWIDQPTQLQEDPTQTRASDLDSEATRFFAQAETEMGSVSESHFKKNIVPTTKAKRYEVLKTLGVGGMGVVQLMFDHLLGREVAIKTIQINRAQMDTLSSVQKHKLFRLKTEASITAILEHPNIVPLYDLQQNEAGEISFSMRKIDGQTFSQILKKNREVLEDQNRVISIFLKVCDAVGYAHAQGVIHRDLKPDNVMVGQFGEVYVMDWGIAKRLSSSEEKNTEGRGLSDLFPGATTDDFEKYGKTIGGLGTPGYMPPEQKKSAASVTPQADIFALGKILRQCFTGLAPHEEFHKILDHYKKQTEEGTKKRTTGREETTKSFFHKKIFTPQENDIKQSLENAIPLDIQAIINRATQAVPSDRYSSVGELVQDVENYLKNFRISAREYTFFELLQKWVSRNRQKLGVALLVLFLCVAFPLYHFWSQNRKRREAFQSVFTQAQQEIQQSEGLDAEGKSETATKIKHLLSALNYINFALSLIPEESKAVESKLGIGEQLATFCCLTQNYHLAHYVADEIKRERFISEAKKQQLRASIIHEEQKMLTQHLERLDYWVQELKNKIPSSDLKESALREISKMPEAEIVQKLVALLNESVSYFLENQEQNEILNQFYYTMVNALGWLENPIVGEALIRALKQFSTHLAPIPPVNRGENKIQQMIVIANALKNAKASEMVDQLHEIRWEMGENSLFWDRSEPVYRSLVQERLKQYTPKSAKEYYDRGVMKQITGDLSGALSDYQESARLDPTFARAYLCCGNMYLLLNQNEPSLIAYTKAIEIKPDYAEAYNSRGSLRYKLNDFEGALADYTEAIRIAPQLFAIYVNRSRLFYALKQYTKSADDCLSAIQIDPYCVKAYVNLGLARHSMNDIAGAFLAYNKALEIHPEMIEAYQNRASLWREQQEIEKAIEDYSKVIQYRPTFADAYFQRASMRKQKEQLDAALQDYNEAIRLDPQNPSFYFERGILKKTKLNQSESAEADFQKALAMAPNNLTFLNNLGGLSEKTGNVQEGIDLFSKIIQLDPDNQLAYYNRGVLKLQKEDFAESVSDFTQAIALNPSYTSAYGERGVAKIQQGDVQGALDDFSKAIELDPRYFHAYTNRGRIKYQLRDIVGANQDFSKAIELNPNAENAYEQRALLKRNQGDLIGALSDYTELIRLDPKNLGATINRGAIKQQLGDIQGALDDFKKALVLDPNEPMIFYNQGVCYYKLGQLQEAIEVLEAGIEKKSSPEMVKLLVDFLMERMRKNLKQKAYESVLEDIQRFKKSVPAEHKYQAEIDKLKNQIETQLKKK